MQLLSYRMLLVACFSLPLVLTGQTVPNQSVLTLETIMQGERFVGYSPSGVFWGQDNATIYFNWNPEMDTLPSLYKATDGGQPEKVSLEEEKALLRGGVFDRDRRWKAFDQNGDLFLLELATGTVQQLTNTLDREANPVFTPEGDLVFSSRNNLYLYRRAGGVIEQLTDFRSGAPRTDRPLPENEQWLERDQMEYFEVLRWRKGQSEARQARREALQPDRPLSIYTGKDAVMGLQASPDLRFVTWMQRKDAQGRGTKVPNYVTETGFIEDLRSRDKVGAPQDTYKFGIYDRERDTSFYLDTKQIPGIYDKPDFLRDYHQGEEPFEEKYAKPREVIIMGPVYSNDGKAVVVIRSQDNKDRWIMLLDPASGTLELLDRQRDEAWVGGPGVGGWNASTGNIGWMPDDTHLWFQSEATGYSHLYTVNVSTGAKKALTSGTFEIRDAQLAGDKSCFWITANAEGPHEQHFYRLPLAGGTLERITTMEGNNEVTLSPDEKMLAIRYSYSNKPWELYVMENRPGAEARRLTHSTTDAFEAYPWRVPEIVWFTAADGARVPARVYRPEKTRRNGPAVIFVHGAGYLQNVHKWWSSYYREYMFHNMLADNGFTVMDIDYRGSDGYGRDWRTDIYRFMGGKDLSDQVDGARFLVEEYGVSPEKIGIYGGSYGGFITLMAQFTAPGTFRSGAALRSVTDWAHYNHGYTSNILNTPVEDSIAYYRSSPIYHAEGLQDNLLILHGMIDRNVQFQDVVRLAQRLIELGKDKWEFAVFPLEDHGFVEPSSWTDEYRRIYKLFRETLK